MTLVPHLTFDGRCREAFTFYQQTFGGTIGTMLTYGDSPLAGQTAPAWHDRILHATLTVGDAELAGADLPPDEFRRPHGFFVLVQQTTPEAAERLFARLADDGEVIIPMQPTFWSPRYGTVVDRFGTPWEISAQ